MRRKVIAGNWKMNMLPNEAIDYIQAFEPLVKDAEAEVVRMIYGMAINGHSLQDIQTELFSRGIKSPSGKDRWTRDVIDKTINNSKYLDYIIPIEKFIEASIEKESRCRYIRS